MSVSLYWNLKNLMAEGSTICQTDGILLSIMRGNIILINISIQAKEVFLSILSSNTTELSFQLSIFYVYNMNYSCLRLWDEVCSFFQPNFFPNIKFCRWNFHNYQLCYYPFSCILEWSEKLFFLLCHFILFYFLMLNSI